MRLYLVAAAIVALDQVTKLFIKGVPAVGIEGLPYGSSFEVLGDFFRITYIENPGMAFGIMPGGNIPLAWFSIIAAVVMAALRWWQVMVLPRPGTPSHV